MKGKTVSAYRAELDARTEYDAWIERTYGSEYDEDLAEYLGSEPSGESYVTDNGIVSDGSELDTLYPF